MAFVNLPPNFQDIFNGITDRIAKLETGPNQALYVAESAQGSSTQALIEAEAAAAAAGVAQAQATQALSEATVAYNKAVQSLQPSASTIVNASNQMTAIATNGITVYSGSSATTGARVVMNSLGLAGYNSSGSATFSILASTGTATFSGDVTGATITGSSLNIAGVFIVNGTTGVMTATSATVTGVINATSGYFGSASNGWSISSTGLTGVGTGNITGGLITGSTFQTAASSTRITINSSSDNSIKFYPDSSLNPGFISPSTQSGVGSLKIAGPYASGYSQPNLQMYSLGAGTAYMQINTDVTIQNGAFSATGNFSASGNSFLYSSVQFGVSNTFEYLSSSGTLRSQYTYGKAVSSARAMQINSSGDFGTTASTLRKKHDVAPYAIDTSKLLQLEVKSFKYLPEIDENQDEQYGFIAEQAESLGLLPLILYDAEGRVDYFAYEKLPIFLLQLAQEQEARLKLLEGN